MTQDTEVLTITTLLPTAAEWRNEGLRPVTKYTDSSDAHEAWELLFKRHWHNEGGSPPEWVSNYGEPKYNWHYLRVPGVLLISSSLDVGEENIHIPWNPELNFSRENFVLGNTTPDVNTPGVYEFYVDFEVPETSASYLNPLGRMESSFTVDSNSMFYDELSQMEYFDSVSSELKVKTENHYGIEYTHAEDLGDALETAYDRLDTMHSIVSVAFMGFGNALVKALQGATLTLRLVAKETTKEAIMEVATDTLVNESLKRIANPSANELSDEDVRDARIIEGTAFYSPTQGGNVAFSGSTVVVRSPSIPEIYPHTLVIKGTGDDNKLSARYEVESPEKIKAVEGKLPAGDGSVTVTKNEADQIKGITATGTVWAGADGYRFSGNPESLSVTTIPSEGAVVYVDGERREPDYSRAVVISGGESTGRAEYGIEVSGRIKKSGLKLPVGDEWVGVGLNEPDEVNNQTARGTVINGRDGFVFSGEIESLTVAPPNEATVYVDGQEESPDHPHTLVINGKEESSRVTYEVSVTDDIRGYSGKLPAGDESIGVELNETDEVGEKSANGIVTGGADGYLFAGKVKSLNIDPPGEATVYVDGEQRPVDGGENEAPTAAFDVSPKSPSPGEEVVFDASEASDPDGRISKYKWAFIEQPDQTPFDTTTGETVTQEFSSGTYAIRLTVIADDGSSDIKYTTLQVGKQAPIASFDANPQEPALDEAVTFDAGQSEDPDGTIVSYDWEVIRANDPSSTHIETGSGKLFTHTFRKTGRYSVRLTVTDDDGATNTASLEVPIEEGEGPEAKIEAPDGPVPVGTDVTFSGEPSTDPEGQIVNYNWLIKRNGELTRFTGKTFTHHFSESGKYTVTLKVVNEDSVSATTSTKITVGERPVARFDMSPDSPVDPHESVTFDAGVSTDQDGSIAEYEWEFQEKPTQNAKTDSGEKVTRSFSAGTYAVKLTVRDDDGFSDSTSKTLRVTQPPEARFDISPPSPTANEEILFDATESHDPDGTITSYDWKFQEKSTQNVEIDSGATVNRNLTSGQYEVTLTVTDDESQTDTVSKTLDVAPSQESPVARFEVSEDSPEPDEMVTFDASGSTDPDGSIGSYEWSVYRMAQGEIDPNPIATLTGQSVTYSFVDSGTYAVELTVTDNSGKIDTASKSVNVNAPPEATFDMNPLGPEASEDVTFDASESDDPDGSIVSYDWEFREVGDQNPDTDSGKTVTRSFTPGEHAVTLIVTDDAGAMARKSKTLNVEETNRPPTASIEAPTERVYVGMSITLDGSGSSDPDGEIVSYEWEIDPPVGEPITKYGSTASYKISDEGTHQISLTVTDNDGETDTTGVRFMARESPGRLLDG